MAVEALWERTDGCTCIPQNRKLCIKEVMNFVDDVLLRHQRLRAYIYGSAIKITRRCSANVEKSTSKQQRQNPDQDK